MRNFMVVVLLLTMAGCAASPWFQAKALSGADTKQAIALQESQDVKSCDYVRGSGSAYGVDGIVERLLAFGQNVSMQDCIGWQNKTVTPVVLPASRQPMTRPLPPEG